MRGAGKLVFVRDEAAVLQRDAEASGLLVSGDRAGVTSGFQKCRTTSSSGMASGPAGSALPA